LIVGVSILALALLYRELLAAMLFRLPTPTTEQARAPAKQTPVFEKS
jgi:hypothetical protein